MRMDGYGTVVLRDMVFEREIKPFTNILELILNGMFKYGVNAITHLLTYLDRDFDNNCKACLRASWHARESSPKALALTNSIHEE